MSHTCSPFLPGRPDRPWIPASPWRHTSALHTAHFYLKFNIQSEQISLASIILFTSQQWKLTCFCLFLHYLDRIKNPDCQNPSGFDIYAVSSFMILLLSSLLLNNILSVFFNPTFSPLGPSPPQAPLGPRSPWKHITSSLTKAHKEAHKSRKDKMDQTRQTESPSLHRQSSHLLLRLNHCAWALIVHTQCTWITLCSKFQITTDIAECYNFLW